MAKMPATVIGANKFLIVKKAKSRTPRSKKFKEDLVLMPFNIDVVSTNYFQYNIIIVNFPIQLWLKLDRAPAC